MVIVLAAQAAPVVCDALEATTLVRDADLDPLRIPVIQPNLLPGLARKDAGRAAETIDRLCGDGRNVSLAPAESWQGTTFGAYTFVLTRSKTEGCALEQEAVVLTVGVADSLSIRVRGRLPPTVTPIGPCNVISKYRDESEIAGAGTPVRLVLVSDHVGGTVHHKLVARRATPQGWHEQVLFDPAPERLVDSDGGGPLVTLLGTEDPWIVAHANREIENTCSAIPGQVIWRWEETHWKREEGRAALGRLADRGAWRLTGEPGWFMIVAQDIASDRGLLDARRRRLQRRSDDPLLIRPSADFPLLNAGFLIVSPDPWGREEDAVKARRSWGRRMGAYVKQGWSPPDPCAQR